MVGRHVAHANTAALPSWATCVVCVLPALARAILCMVSLLFVLVQIFELIQKLASRSVRQQLYSLDRKRSFTDSTGAVGNQIA